MWQPMDDPTPRREVTPAGPPRARAPDRGTGCDTCGGLGWVTGGLGLRASAAPCACSPVCAQCEGSTLVRVAVPGSRRGAMTRCGCWPAARAAALYSGAGVPARYHGARLEGDRGQRVRSLLDEGRSLVLSGGLGRGKTHTLAAIAYEAAMVRGWTCRYVDVVQLAQDRREAMRPDAQAEEPISSICAADVVLVDELGRSRSTEWEQSIVEEIVGRRYEARKPLYAATNLDRVALANAIGERAHSRLVEMGPIIAMGGESQRDLRAGQG